jgi:transposase-like protein
VKAGLHRTQGVVAFGVVLYVLGLSYRSVAAALRCLLGHGSSTTIYRDVVAAGEKTKEMHRARQGKPVRIMGIDGTGQKMKGGSVGVAFAVDAEQQVLVGVELVEEEDERDVRRFVTRLCEEYGVEFVVTDEHDSYKRAMQSRRIRAEHRFCGAHWKKSKQLRIRRLREQAVKRGYRRWVRDLDQLSRLIRDGPDDAGIRLQKIHHRYLDYPPPPPGRPWSLGYHLRMLTLHLLDTWNRIGAGEEHTNNTAERLIGLLLKIRSKTMRGFAKPENILRFVHLAAHLWQNREDCDLRAVC